MSIENTEIDRLKAEVSGLRLEIEKFRARERDLEESRRAMLYMLEDLNESSENIDRARREWETTFDGISGPVYLHDSELKVLRANKAYIREAGLPPEEIIGRPYSEIFPLRDGPYIFCNEAMKAGCEKEGEVSADSGRIFKLNCCPIRDETGKYLFSVHIMEDITDRKKAEEEKAKLEDQLRHSQKMEAVGTLAGGIAHDFNNILNVIIGYSSMLMDRLMEDPLSKEQIHEVLAAADRAANLTKRLLVFSRRQVMEMKPVNVNQSVIDMEKMLCRIIGEDISFNLELTSRKLIVKADAGQLEQVLMNLVSNARYAMPKGGRLTISTDIKEMDEEYITAYGYGKPGTYAHISVADTGSGMDAETQKKIFEPFFTTKGVGEGTGLGLSIVYGIIKQHDGYIKVYSEPGKGTEFKIYLPLVEGETAGGQEVVAAAPIKGGKETILLAEDDASLRKLSRIVLESFGYTVITAEDGEEAITRYRENRNRISLVILDMIMPKKNGKEAYEEIKRIGPEVKALFVSGYTMDISHKKELLDKGLDYILKPVSSKDLLKKVRAAIDS